MSRNEKPRTKAEKKAMKTSRNNRKNARGRAWKGNDNE